MSRIAPARVPPASVRQRCQTYCFSTFLFKAQLRWLDHILRKPEADPLRNVVFEPNSRRPPKPRSLTFRPAPRKVGRPSADWVDTFFQKFTVFPAPIETPLPQCLQAEDFINHLSSAYVVSLIAINLSMSVLRFFLVTRLVFQRLLQYASYDIVLSLLVKFHLSFLSRD